MSTVTVLGWNIGFEKVQFTKLLKDKLGYSLSEAKALTDAVLENKRFELQVEDSDYQALLLKMSQIGLKIASADLKFLHPGSLITTDALPIPEVASILALTDRLEHMPATEKAKLLTNRRVALLFYESSTRTRTSFELAAKSLGATTTLVSDKSSSIEKGESLKDTGLTLRALGAECIILRHPSSGSPFVLASATGLPVLNAGDGMAQHPSQALLDLRTILARLELAKKPVDAKTLSGLTITITGDILHSRVARSNAMLLPRLGAKVILCGPEALLPETARCLEEGIEITRDFDAALQRSQVVMMLRIQKERLSGLHLDLARYIDRFQLNESRLAAHASKALVMHPGPMVRGLEIAGEVADGPQSAILDQVANGLAIRSALLVRALGSEARTLGGKA